MKCANCSFDGNPNLEEAGPHVKATCPECGHYIKMVSKKEVARMMAITKEPVVQTTTYRISYGDSLYTDVQATSFGEAEKLFNGLNLDEEIQHLQEV